MITITGGGVFSRQNVADINANFSTILPFTPGNIIYLNPSSPNLSVPPTGSIDRPFTDITAAYGAGRIGKNDVIVLVGNGASSGSARISTTFTWAKSGLHLVGIAPPSLSSQRARIAPVAGMTAFANFFVVSASGCLFQNIQWFHGFTAGTTAEICMNVTGSNNAFLNCQFAGMADTDAAGGNNSSSRNLKIGSAGSGENYFQDCTIGVDTIARNTTNASLELAGGTPRNVFRRCNFLTYATNSGVLTILGTGNTCVDRMNEFDDCSFVNSVKSGSGTTMTALGSFTTNAPGGLIVFKKCMSVGSTKWGDANFLANAFIDMAAPASTTGGLAVNPA